MIIGQSSPSSPSNRRLIYREHTLHSVWKPRPCGISKIHAISQRNFEIVVNSPARFVGKKKKKKRQEAAINTNLKVPSGRVNLSVRRFDQQERTRWERGGRWKRREGRVTVWNFRENYNRNSSTLHGYTRNVHRVHSSVEGCYTWSKPACTVTYIRSFPRLAPSLFEGGSPLPPPSHQPPSSTHLWSVPLSSYGRASAALFAYYRRAACRQQAIEIPFASLSSSLCPLRRCYPFRLPIARSDKGENAYSPVFSLTKISIRRARYLEHSALRRLASRDRVIAEFLELKHAE